MDLRPYQLRAIEQARAHQKRGRKRILIVAPTGSGKTVIAAKGMIVPAVAKGYRVLFVVHLREVVEQAAAKLEEYGVPHGFILAGKRTHDAPVQVASIQTISRRTRPPAELVFVDEAHRSNARQYRELIEAYPDATIIGLTATPVRGDGTGLGAGQGPFEELVVVATPEELVREGYLVSEVIYGVDAPDVSGVPISRMTRDFDEAKLGEVYTRDVRLVGDAVEQWVRHANRLRTIVFAANRKHGRALEEAFGRRKIPCAYVDGTTALRTRREAIEKLKHGTNEVLVNVNVYTEGFDEPMIGCIQVCRATLSLGRWIQMAGRGLRPITDTERSWCAAHGVPIPDKRHLVVLDHGANVQRFGLPTATREWSLDGRKEVVVLDEPVERPPPPTTWTCIACRRVVPVEQGNVCPSCGREGGPPIPRTTAGQLVELRSGSRWIALPDLTG